MILKITLFFKGNYRYVFEPGELALSCNPGYREVRTVGWFEVSQLLITHLYPHYGVASVNCRVAGAAHF